MNLLIAINGTHDNLVLPMAPAEYDRVFQGSHVDRIFKHCLFTEKLYIRGPTGAGGGVEYGLVAALDFIWRVQIARPGEALALHLIGFSRGAAMCLELANWLAESEPLGRLSYLKPTIPLRCVALLRQIDKSLVTVKALGMFDAVDMSLSMDCDPIHPKVERSVQIRRAGWHSREGWTNVGDTPAPGTPRTMLREHWPLIGTHGAMGGQPVNGDIPIPLARELMTALGSPKLPINQPAWTRATMRWMQAQKAGSLAKVLTQKNDKSMRFDAAAEAKARIDLVDFHELLRSYANVDYMVNIKGIGASKANQDLFGFPGLFWIFQDSRICMGIIGRYAALDRKASADAMALMRKGLGPGFPATLRP